MRLAEHCEKKHEFPRQPVDTHFHANYIQHLTNQLGPTVVFGGLAVQLGGLGSVRRFSRNFCRLRVANSPDSRSAVAIAFEWSFTVMTISAEMVVPGLLGYWLDQKLGTQVLFLLLGLVGGSVLAAWSLARVARRKGSNGKKSSEQNRS
jgi:F0F1-type ATP synthase assembly protein I